jgi:hypothetical protein
MNGHGGARPGAGRKPGSQNKATAEIRDLARNYAPEAIEELARLAMGAMSETARVAAIRELLDRAYGKPKQELEADLPVVNFNLIGLEEHRARRDGEAAPD